MLLLLVVQIANGCDYAHISPRYQVITFFFWNLSDVNFKKVLDKKWKFFMTFANRHPPPRPHPLNGTFFNFQKILKKGLKQGFWTKNSCFCGKKKLNDPPTNLNGKSHVKFHFFQSWYSGTQCVFTSQGCARGGNWSVSKICCNVDNWISFFLFDAAELSLAKLSHWEGGALLWFCHVRRRSSSVKILWRLHRSAAILVTVYNVGSG